jgi:hypothetical protein
VLLNATSVSRKHPELFRTDQAPSQSETRADEGPSPQIFQPGMHAVWDAMALLGKFYPIRFYQSFYDIKQNDVRMRGL